MPNYGQKLSTLGRAAGSFRGGAEAAVKNVDLGFLAPFFLREGGIWGARQWGFPDCTGVS